MEGTWLANLHPPVSLRPLVLELTFVFRAVEVAFRFCDQSFVVKLPEFVAADSNVFFPFVSLKRNIDGN